MPPSAVEPLVLWDVFRGAAPSLRQVKLHLVRLPATLDYPAFQNITVFFYELIGTTTAADLRVLSKMPQLEVFQWGGELSLSRDAVTDCGSGWFPLPLRTVLLSSRDDVDAADLRGLFPVQQLRELWITVRTEGHDTCHTLPSLYPDSAVRGLSVCCSSSGLVALLDVVHPEGGGTTTVVIAPRLISTRVEALVTPFARCMTWLTIHEYLWDNDATGTPPVLPSVVVLSVCLASIDDYTREWQGRWFWSPWSGGVFTADPGCCWAFPALREIRITSPPKAERDPAAGDCILSISLADVARWVEVSIFDEPSTEDVAGWPTESIPIRRRKLDKIVLSGVRIVDYDFCAAWDAVMELSHSLELCERPDGGYHTSCADMDFELRSASFSGDGHHLR
ncbi:hypothetical protein AURDEDRAFT_170185 [Auricularia subglabra TFB-10046 SS5]|nr:hypothetical protein AURDEDRAFT_170185 [Auricularia subglabra TFB-10046 SS5]